MTVVQRCSNDMAFTGFYMFLLGSSLPESASALSPTVQLNAEVGTLFLEQGILKVAVDGFYLDDKLSAKIELHLEGRQKCSGSELERRCSSTSHSESYEDVSEALRAIDAAASALNTGTALKRRFRMDAAPGCNPSWSEVTVAPHGTLAEFVLGEGASSYPITADADQLVAFRSALQRASDLRDHLRPQIDAFNRTPPDRSMVRAASPHRVARSRTRRGNTCWLEQSEPPLRLQQHRVTQGVLLRHGRVREVVRLCPNSLPLLQLHRGEPVLPQRQPRVIRNRRF